MTSSKDPAANDISFRDRSTSARPRKRKTRAEKTEETRHRLLRAAADIIGDEGYAKATIAKITTRADLSLGTFYTYFENRDDLFDQLLPLMGADMIGHIRERTREAPDVLAQEEAGLRAFFQFMEANPGFYRLLNEAETMAPRAYQQHFQNTTERYVRALRRGKANGELAAYADDELETLVYILMAARNYLIMRYRFSGRAPEELNEKVLRTYMKFVSGGLRFRAGDSAGEAG